MIAIGAQPFVAAGGRAHRGNPTVISIGPINGEYRSFGIPALHQQTRHTEDYVVGGVTGTFDRPGSLLLGRYDERGTLRFVGQTHRLRVEHRREFAGLRPMAFVGGNSGHPWRCPLPAGWSADFADRAPLPYVPVEPTVVAEVDADLARDGAFERLRHRCRFVRVRPELTPQDVATISRVGELVAPV